MGITAIGLTIWGVKKHLSSKDDPSKKDNEDNNRENSEDIKVPNAGYAKKLNEDSPKKDEKISNNGTLNKKNNAKTQDQEFKFRDQNMKMIREKSGLSKEKIDKLISIIDLKGSILNYIDRIYSTGYDVDDDGNLKVEVFYDKKSGVGLNKEITDKYGLSDGNSWVEKLFDDIRGKAKIFKIEQADDVEFHVFMKENDEYCWYSLLINGKFFNIQRIDPDEGIEDITVSYVFEEGNI